MDLTHILGYAGKCLGNYLKTEGSPESCIVEDCRVKVKSNKAGPSHD